MDTESSFLSLFPNLDISRSSFEKELKVLDYGDKSGLFVASNGIDGFLKKIANRKGGDSRIKRHKEYIDALYRLLVLDRRNTLIWWFERYVKCQTNLDHFRLPIGPDSSNGIFNAQFGNKYNRICRDLNFLELYSTKKNTPTDSQYVIGLMAALFNDLKIRNSLLGPAFFDHICHYSGNPRMFWLDFMLGANRPSVFNPVAYCSILRELFEGCTLYAPTMDWNVYQLAFYSSSFTHFIGTDVIPSVIQNGVKLHAMSKSTKTVDLMCAPSESLVLPDNSIDAILFSPPYFNLELYVGPNQSTTNYPNYVAWLYHYWLKTIRQCAHAMCPGARLGFIVGNYPKCPNLSQDMMSVVATELNFKKKYSIEWSAWGKNCGFNSRQPKKMRGGNCEDLWLFEK